MTGDAVVLDVQIAQLPVRAVSAIIDMTVIFIGYLLGLMLWATALSQLDEALTIAFLIMFTVLAFVGYPVAIETATRGRSVGKIVMGLRVVSDDGARNASARRCFARWRRWWRSGCCWAARP
ncbi:RDD family protein [Mycobacterium kansasii]|uniref:RDD family protein n=1 Tax=Mycobacterium kansasii TaxID=1768 RepID=A0A1V3X152_MYCKA|nr:RDD family protein [Mycobacterium kansasii]